MDKRSQMQPQRRNARKCPVHAFQKLIGGKYKLRIIWDLREEPRRYNEIRRGLLKGQLGSGEIPARVLSRELKALSDAGVLHRKDFGEVPPKVEYSLSKTGKGLIPVIAVIHSWGMENL